jgi:hypothetical protein
MLILNFNNKRFWMWRKEMGDMKTDFVSRMQSLNNNDDEDDDDDRISVSTKHNLQQK